MRRPDPGSVSTPPQDDRKGPGRPQGIVPTIGRVSPPGPCIVGTGLAPVLGGAGAHGRRKRPFPAQPFPRPYEYEGAFQQQYYPIDVCQR
ncbi:MAG TPA: hypothetical protein VF026_30490 [Ktedonobacteraceae bacterium]